MGSLILGQVVLVIDFRKAEGSKSKRISQALTQRYSKNRVSYPRVQGGGRDGFTKCSTYGKILWR